MSAAIRETRARLATRLARTADHVHASFTAPSLIHAEAPDRGFIGAAVKAIAVAGRTRRAWADARSRGAFRRAALGIAVVAIGTAFAKRRFPS